MTSSWLINSSVRLIINSSCLFCPSNIMCWSFWWCVCVCVCVWALLTSMSLELLPGSVGVAGTMGLLAGGAVGPEQCWGMPGETGSILTMAGAEPRQTDWDKTTAGENTGRIKLHEDTMMMMMMMMCVCVCVSALTGSALVHGGEALQDEGLGRGGGLWDGQGGDTHRSGLDGGLGAQDGRGLQRGRTGQNWRGENNQTLITVQ